MLNERFVFEMLPLLLCSSCPRREKTCWKIWRKKCIFQSNFSWSSRWFEKFTIMVNLAFPLAVASLLLHLPSASSMKCFSGSKDLSNVVKCSALFMRWHVAPQSTSNWLLLELAVLSPFAVVVNEKSVVAFVEDFLFWKQTCSTCPCLWQKLHESFVFFRQSRDLCPFFPRHKYPLLRLFWFKTGDWQYQKLDSLRFSKLYLTSTNPHEDTHQKTCHVTQQNKLNKNKRTVNQKLSIIHDTPPQIKNYSSWFKMSNCILLASSPANLAILFGLSLWGLLSLPWKFSLISEIGASNSNRHILCNGRSISYGHPCEKTWILTALTTSSFLLKYSTTLPVCQ